NISLNIDLAVTDISANNETQDENLETITANIENIGYGNASDFIVKFFMDDPNRLFHSTNVTKLDSNTSTTVTANWTADTWNEKEGKATLNHTIWVEIDCCENSDLNVVNNRNSRPIQVNPTRDFSVTNLSFIQDMESKQTKINAIIKNFGEVGSTNISIHAEKYGKKIPIYFASHLVDAVRCMDMQWDASIVGHYTINATVDPDSRTLEINESNNSKIQSVYIEAPDLTIVNLTSDDPTPLEGGTVNITAEIANVGDRPADASFIIYDHERAPEELSPFYHVNPKGRGIISETISKNNATAIRLYLNYKIPEGYLRLYDSKDRLISFILLDNDPFSGWTEWVVGDNITVELETSGDGGHFQILKDDYLTTDDIINRTLLPEGTASVTVNWNVPTAGERTILAIIDSDNNVLELNEENNIKTEFLLVRGADLIVSELQLTVNGTEINDTISNGTIVNINATITNIGIKPTAKDFNVTLVCDDIRGERMEITNVTIPYLNPDNSTNVIAIWNATIGDYTITAIADPENSIFETSDSNNTLSKNVVVLGADLLITGIKFRVLPPEGADINDASSPLYDTDKVVINATIKNQGLVQADNFSAYTFYEYEYLGKNYRERNWRGDGYDIWMNKGYDGAECICIYITDTYNINGRLIVYDGNGMEVARPDKSCWIPVMGDTANIKYSNVHGLGFTVDWYAGNITKFENLSLVPGKSINISMRQPVGTGNHPARVFADPENIVPGDPDQNNCANLTLHVLPSRDFIPGIYLTHNGSGIEVNDTVWDGNTVTVNVDIRMGINESDPYNEYRNGTVDVDIIDEHEWIDASPCFELTDDGYAQVIRYPGADAIRVQFKELDVSPRDVVEIRDRNRTLLCTLSSYTSTSPWLDRDEIYFYKVQKPADYGNYRYIACEIDKYQYRIINNTTVELAANETAHTSAHFTPYAGDHTLRAVIDPDDEISEILESNNEANETIYIEPCRDPAVVDIAFSPEMPDPGTAVNITANVTNYGNITSTVTIDLYATKLEYRPCESLHPDLNSQVNSVFEWDIATYPEANWTGVHFTRISTDVSTMNDDETYLHVCDKGGNLSEDFYGLDNEEDVWAWVKGDLLKIKTKLFCAAQRGCIWGFSIDTVAHTVTLNQTTLTLNPGETASVTGTLPNVRIGNQSFHYTITAVVDQDNIVFETNELNNVVSRELVANCPDLKVDFNPPDEAVIRNIGTKVAENVEVRLWHDASYSQKKYWNGMKFPPKSEMPDDESDDELDAVRVHFEKLEFDLGEVWIRNENYDIIHTIYPGNYLDTWVEVEGKKCGIYYNSKDVEDIEIDRYEYAYDKKVSDILAGNREKETIPWTEYEAPYNLTIDVDPENYVIESNEDNNNKTIRMGADIAVRWIYVDPYAPIMGDTCYIKGIKNIGNLPTGEFNLTISINATDEIAFEHNKTINETISLAPYEEYNFPWDSPEIEPPEDIDYEIRIVVDPEDVVKELNEDNNKASTSEPLTVYSHTNYTGGKLYLYDTNWVYGGIKYSIGDSTYVGSTWNDYVVNFEGVIPENIKEDDIKLARLYLYWTWGKAYSINESKFVPVPIEANLKFNDRTISEDRRYLDYPHATDFDVAWGTYTYEIPPDAIKSDNSVIVDRYPFKTKYESDKYYLYPQEFGIYGIGLFVVYESDDGVLTNYWINEGGDVIYDEANALGIEDMVTSAAFKGKVEDQDMTNATLWTVTPGGNDENVLYFNNMGWGNVWIGEIGIDHRCVTEHLIHKDNTARLQYISGNSMMSSGAFLVLRYPPDLAVTDIDAPVSAVVGNKYVINTTINNEGRSNATDFNVSFYSNNVRVGGQKISLLDSGDNITLQFNWKPMHMGKIYKLKVAADVISGQDWVELDVDNNEMTKNVPIVASGFGNESGAMGEGEAGAGGSGDGDGVSLFDKITGILMKGSTLKDGGGGGGGIGEFSLLEWIMKGLILTTCFMLVYFGYSMEKRRHNKK
ncbi:MAG TPA: DUF3344 domain-containing protein, partial [Methanosarcinales archaeon]|nr:DUF3344 domain-containing protein [Methanosarcinales archaeon]